MIQAWFVSDIHINDMHDEKAKTLLAFLHSLKTERPCTHLFLVGDIFDLWIGDHQYFVKRFQPLINQIQRLVNEGVEVHYFEGNHDLYLKGFWENKMGVHVHAEAEYFDLGGKIFRVEHGDQTDPEDRGYLFLRWFLRTPIMRLVAWVLPGFVVQKIGERASAKSRNYTSHVKRIDADTAIKKLRVHAEKAYQEHEFEYLVFGHVHVRDDYKHEKFRALNLGTWLETPIALNYSDRGVQFVDLI